jgi:hypothetical protein
MVKRVKPRPLDVEAVLKRGSLPEATATLRRLVADDDQLAALLLQGVDGPWRDLMTPTRCAGALVMLGASDVLLDHCLDVADDWVQQDDELADAGHRGVFGVLGATLDETGWRRLLEALGDAETVEAPRPSWPLWVTVLADCGERGLRDERAWAWLGRVLDDTPPLWCIYAGGYGDDRAVPILRALLRGTAERALADTGPRGEDDDVVIEAGQALERLSALDDEARDLLARHDRALAARPG